MAPESPLSMFIDECKGSWLPYKLRLRLYWLVDLPWYWCEVKTPLERAKLLESTPLFADIHAEEASAGQSAVPTNLDTDYHFTCFVEAPSAEPGQVKGEQGRRLVELDGRRAGPVDRGPCTDLLKVSDKLTYPFIQGLTAPGRMLRRTSRNGTFVSRTA